MEAAQNFVVAFKPTIWHRLGFGHAYVSPWNDDDGDAHYICTDTIVVLDWRDRLRVLLTGRAQFAVRTMTDVPVGATTSRAAFKVMGWGWRQ